MEDGESLVKMGMFSSQARDGIRGSRTIFSCETEYPQRGQGDLDNPISSLSVCYCPFSCSSALMD